MLGNFECFLSSNHSGVTLYQEYVKLGLDPNCFQTLSEENELSLCLCMILGECSKSRVFKKIYTDLDPNCLQKQSTDNTSWQRVTISSEICQLYSYIVACYSIIKSYRYIRKSF